MNIPTEVEMLRPDADAAAMRLERREDRRGLDDVSLRAALAEQARLVRRHIVTTIDMAGAGHIGGDLSVTDILVTLFEHVLDIDPTEPTRPERDRFVLSKGHCSAALYATLAHAGYFSADQLATFIEFFYTLRKNDREGVWQLDQFPFREDSVAAANLAIDFLKRIDASLDRLDVDALQAAQAAHDAVGAHRVVQAAPWG